MSFCGSMSEEERGDVLIVIVMLGLAVSAGELSSTRAAGMEAAIEEEGIIMEARPISVGEERFWKYKGAVMSKTTCFFFTT